MLERLRASIDLHAHHGALPRGEEKGGDVVSVQIAANFSDILPRPDALGERSGQGAADLNQIGTKQVARFRYLEAHIADKAAVPPIGSLEPLRDGREVGSDALHGRSARITQCIIHDRLRALMIALKHGNPERFLRTEVVRETPLGNASVACDLADAGGWGTRSVQMKKGPPQRINRGKVWANCVEAFESFGVEPLPFNARSDMFTFGATLRSLWNSSLSEYWDAVKRRSDRTPHSGVRVSNRIRTRSSIRQVSTNGIDGPPPMHCDLSTISRSELSGIYPVHTIDMS